MAKINSKKNVKKVVKPAKAIAAKPSTKPTATKLQTKPSAANKTVAKAVADSKKSVHKSAKPAAKSIAPKKVSTPNLKDSSKLQKQQPIKKTDVKVALIKDQAKKEDSKNLKSSQQSTQVSKKNEVPKGPQKEAPKAIQKPIKKTKKAEEFDEADLIGDDADFSNDELIEYEADLKSAETIETDDVNWLTKEDEEEVKKASGEIILTDAEGRRYCRVKECDQIANVDLYCRYHYLLLWKKIQIRKKILTDGKLARYVEELTSRYPDKFLEVIRRDLATEKDFLSAIQELEIDDSQGSDDNDYEEESQNYIDEMRGTETVGTTDDDEY